MLLRASTGGISRADLYRRVKDRLTAGELTDALRSLAERGLVVMKEGARPKHGRAAVHYYATTTPIVIEGGRELKQPSAMPAPLAGTFWRSLALQVIEARLLGTKPTYRDTQPGRADLETLKAAETLTRHWREHPAEPISVAALGREMLAQHGDGDNTEIVDQDTGRRIRLPLAVTALAKRKLVKLTTKSTVIIPGEHWAET